MSGTLAVMQPTFLPWAGYFNLIAEADYFVFLDDVQLEKQSWQTRNRLFINGNARWVSIPIRNVSLSQSIAETEVAADERWRSKLARSFAQAYGRHRYFQDAEEVMSRLLSFEGRCLAELNEGIIRFVAERLRLTTCFYKSSELPEVGVRSERLLALCDQFHALEYLSPIGAAEYLQDDGFALRSKAALRLQNFIPGEYKQLGGRDFVPRLSVVDVLANLGWDETRKYVSKRT